MLDIVDNSHPLFKNIPDPYTMPMKGSSVPYDLSWDSNDLTDGTYVALGDKRESAIVVCNGLVFISPWVENMPSTSDLQLLYNAIVWSKYIPPLKLKVQPDTGSVGTQINIQGSEATPNASIEIYWENTLVGTVTADSNGNFLFVFPVPPSTAGVHNIKAIEPSTGRRGSATFTVIPSLSLNPSVGPAGTRVTVSGHGFTANMALVATFDDTFTTAWIVTDENGSFTFVLNVPLAAAGPHLIKAFGYIYRPPEYKQELLYAEAMFTVKEVTPLEVNVDAGVIFFKGETAEFFVQTAFNGRPVDATSISATLYMPSGATAILTAQRIAKGLYKIKYTISGKGSMTGTYTLVVEAGYITDTVNAYGTSLKTFLVKPTWERDAPRVAAFSTASIGLASVMVLLWRKEKKKKL
jgi:hypothetical protein